MASETFYLVTYFGTIVGRDQGSGGLRHLSLPDIGLPLEFKWINEETLALAKECRDHKPAAGDFDLLRESLPVTITRAPSQEGFGLKVRGRYATADFDGCIRFAREQLLGWEIFQPVLKSRVIEMVSRWDRRHEISIPQPRRSFAIPKIIHQVYFVDRHGDFPPPDVVIDNINLIRARNPDWSYRLWTRKDIYDFIYDQFGFNFFSLFLKINHEYPVARVDLFKLLLMYRRGGVYLDVKSNCTKPLSEVISDDDQFLLSHWETDIAPSRHDWGRHYEVRHIEGFEYINWFIAAAPGHPYLEQAIINVCSNILNYDPIIQKRGGIAVLRTTGPIPYSLAIHKLLDQQPHRFIRIDQEGLLYEAFPNRTSIFPTKHFSHVNTDVVL
jgi:inositol phosphorylceramide mannosyltransferase catalytic subunit